MIAVWISFWSHVVARDAGETTWEYPGEKPAGEGEGDAVGAAAVDPMGGWFFMK